MPNKPPVNSGQALAGCSLALALVATILLSIAWLMSGADFKSPYAVPALIGCVLCVILGKGVEPPAAP